MRIYTRLSLHGNLWAAVWWIIDRGWGRVYQPGGVCSKTWEKILNVIQGKHLEARPSTEASFSYYIGATLTLVPQNIMADTVTEVVCLLYGGAGIRGMDAVSLQNWLL